MGRAVHDLTAHDLMIHGAAAPMVVGRVAGDVVSDVQPTAQGVDSQVRPTAHGVVSAAEPSVH
ncbi:hypothetical protein [Streptomyces sp. NPDC088348]